MVRFPRPHIIVFANQPPDRSKMSADRWNVISLRGEGEGKEGCVIGVDDDIED